ncbi:MAG: hypothetical protein FJ167_03690, partial [Gammaproteobacteria bacterium]|nr:hypothetical protein [Gammaproteobacteria bacterium]
MDVAAAQNRLATVVRTIAVEKMGDLDKLKANHSDLERADFLWHYLLQSFATMGRSSGWKGLIGNQFNYRRVTFEAIEATPEGERLARVRSVLREAKVRMPDRKAEYII